MNVEVCIQHHQSRGGLLPALLERLAGFVPTVVADPGPSGKVDTWRVHRLCLETMSADASHLLVAQDDAVPCADFHDKLIAAITSKPADLICAFTPGFGFLRRRMIEAKRLGHSFVQLPQTSFVPTVAIVYPKVIVERLLAWDSGATWPRRTGPLGRTDDGTLAAFCRATRLRAWATVPSLVDHLDVPSVARPAHRPGGAHRRAAVFER